MMSYFSRAATTIWLSTYWCVAMLFRAIVLALAMLGLAIYLALDFIPKRKSKPLTSPVRHRRLLPIPVNRAGDIYVIMPDDSEVLLEPLQASRQAQLWAEACCGAYVYEKTKLPHR